MRILSSFLVLIVFAQFAFAAPVMSAPTKYEDTVRCYSLFGSNRITFGVFKEGTFEVIRLQVGGVKLALSDPISCSSKVTPNGHYEKEILNCDEAATTAGNDEIKIEATLRIALRMFERFHVDATVDGTTYSIPHCFIRSDYLGEGNDLYSDLLAQLSGLNTKKKRQTRSSEE